MLLLKGKARKWLERANEDFSFATLAFEHKYYLHMMFMCQQALEKTVKAVIEEKIGRPPFKYDLIYLMDIAGILDETTKTKKQFLALLSQYYIESRYPEEKRELNTLMTLKFKKGAVR